MKKRAAAYGALVILGTLFCFYYIHLTSDNVAFSDYIRLINSYLPDVGNPQKFFVPDILTRVPITYLGRIINVKLFQYNTLFDISLGVLSIGVGAAALAFYGAKEQRVSWPWLVLTLLVYFSLNKWEMMTNGTGWVCFLSISGFQLHFAVLDQAVKTDCKIRWQRTALYLFPLILTLLVAGPYCGGYSVILVLAYGTLLAAEYWREKRVNPVYLRGLLTLLLALALYLWSNSYAVYVHRGAVENGSIAAEFLKNPLFFVSFLLKGFASSVVGIAQIQAFEARGSFLGSDAFLYVLGTAVIAMYLWGLYVTWRYEIYKETIFPLLMILSGGLNHLLILVGRWIFLNDTYGMSSRYEIQYQMGIIGLVLTCALLWDKRRGRDGGPEAAEKRADGPEKKGAAPRAAEGRKKAGKPSPGSLLAAVLFACVIFAGNAYTTREELKTAPFRKAYLQISRELGLNYRTASDEDLETYLHSSADAVRSAMEILEENRLNIFAR